MSKTRNTNGGRRERHISVRTVRRSTPDLHKLGRALIQIAMEQAAAEAAAQEQQTGAAGNEFEEQRHA